MLGSYFASETYSAIPLRESMVQLVVMLTVLSVQCNSSVSVALAQIFPERKGEQGLESKVLKTWKKK